MIPMPAKDFWSQLETVCLAAVDRVLEERSRVENAKKLLSTNEAAEMLGISRITLDKWSDRKILKKQKVEGSNKNFYRLADIENLLMTVGESRRRKGD